MPAFIQFSPQLITYLNRVNQWLADDDNAQVIPQYPKSCKAELVATLSLVRILKLVELHFRLIGTKMKMHLLNNSRFSPFWTTHT